MILPIDVHLAGIIEALRGDHLVCLEAPPGTGKTTRVPPALVEAFAPGKVLVLEPRRLAARWSSQRVAEESGQPWGHTVGFQVRFEDRTTPVTKLIYMTQGVFSRKLLRDPDLKDVAVVVLDEFHERNLDNDIALAWLRRLHKQNQGPRVLIMSATLPEGLGQRLGDPPTLRCDVPLHPVSISYRVPRSSLEAAVKEAVDSESPRAPGAHTLIFLPGMREIRACERELSSLAQRRGAELCILHGSLPVSEQDRVLEPMTGVRWILSTNVAETSLTIPGVSCVIDSGLARRQHHRLGKSAQILEVSRISQFSARQRAGRAGRTGPGKCLRLFSEADFHHRPEAEVPDILCSELAELTLFLARLQVTHQDLPWLDSPSPERWASAQRLLQELGALSEGRLTGTGRKMADIPLHPRLARFLLEVPGRRAATVAVAIHEVLLSQPDVLEEIPPEGPPLEKWLQQRQTLRRSVEALGLPPAAARPPSDDELRNALLLCYPDRVGRVRRGRDLMLADGSSLRLPQDIPGDPWVLALQLQDNWASGSPTAQLLAYVAIEPEMLLERPELNDRVALEWAGGAVQENTQLCFGELILEENRRRARPGPEASLLLFQQAQQSSWWRQMQQGFATFAARCRAAGLDPVLPESWLESACEGRTALRELEELRNPGDSLPYSQRQRLERACPASIQLNRKRYQVHYEEGKPPWVAAPLVEFFNLRQGPQLREGQPLTLHLLAPNRRPVQITSDLEGFWLRHYPKIRQELCRRYPRHPWPENPLEARLDWKPTRK